MNERQELKALERGWARHLRRLFFFYDFFVFVNERQELKALERRWAHYLRRLRGACRQNQGLHAAGLED